jgi:uncharacterized Fe-S center protein
MELGGSLFNSTSWLEFFGPTRVEDEVEVVELVVLRLVVGVVEDIGTVGIVDEIVDEAVDEVVDEVVVEVGAGAVTET